MQLKDEMTKTSLFLSQHPLPHSTERTPLARCCQAPPPPYSDHAQSHHIGLSGNLGVCGRVIRPLLVQWGDEQVRLSLML